MKREGDLYNDICSVQNLILADNKARKGKMKQSGIRTWDKARGCNILLLHESLITQDYKTPEYTIFKVYEPKERDVYKLPYRERVVQHAIMNILERLFTSVFTNDSYSCIKGKGIHGAVRMLKKYLKDMAGTTYCLKLDIRKFYPSVDHDVLKAMLRRKIKDANLLWLLDEIIDSAAGVPIGNYLSQYFANFYLSYFDHWLKEVMGVKYYLRYADDIVILKNSKPYLHDMLSEIRAYLLDELKLDVKGNYQVFPVKERGIDFVGYVFRHTHVLLRKSIKQNYARMLAKRSNPASIASYKGWADHCNSKNLQRKLLHENIPRTESTTK